MSSETARQKVPTISVLMAVHNGERHLREAVESILSQDFADIEFVIVDDASDAPAKTILDEFDDPRIRRLMNESNQGLPVSLNRGLTACSGEFVARMDADDIALPNRLSEQLEFLKSDASLAGCGTWIIEIDEEGKESHRYEPPGDPAYVRWALSHRNVLYHPTLLIRRAALQAVGGYDTSMRFAQDYDLFTRLIMADAKLAIVERPLLRYRRGSQSITATRRETQQELAMRVRTKYLRHLLGRSVPEETIQSMWRLFAWEPMSYTVATRSAIELVSRIRNKTAAGKQTQAHIDEEIAEMLQRRIAESLRAHPATAATMARALGRLPKHRMEAVRSWVRAQRSRLGKWRRPGSV